MANEERGGTAAAVLGVFAEQICFSDLNCISSTFEHKKLTSIKIKSNPIQSNQEKSSRPLNIIITSCASPLQRNRSNRWNLPSSTMGFQAASFMDSIPSTRLCSIFRMRLLRHCSRLVQMR